MSIIQSNTWIEEQEAVSWKKAEKDAKVEETKMEIAAIKKHYGENIKITGNMIFGKSKTKIQDEVDRQYAGGKVRTNE